MSASFPHCSPRSRPYRSRQRRRICALLPLFGLAIAARTHAVAIEIPGSDRHGTPPDTRELAFDLGAIDPAAAVDPDPAPNRDPRLKPRSPLTPPPIATVPDAWWSQGSASPVAVALGTAEGTRRPDGGKNPAYYWHTDPGNGANNFGTFSWQHLPPEVMQPVIQAGGAAAKRDVSAQLGLAESADRVAFDRVMRFHDRLRDRAAEKQMSLTLRELLNGLDLANQSPLAGLSPMGYLDRLAQMQAEIADPGEQILEARVWSFWHPRYNRWDAPGLGNTYATIRRDQARRLAAIDAAIAQYIGDLDKLDERGDVAIATARETDKTMAAPSAAGSAREMKSGTASDRIALDF